MTPDSHPWGQSRGQGRGPWLCPTWALSSEGPGPSPTPAIGWRRCPGDDTSGRPAGAGLLPRPRGPSRALTGAGGPDERVNPTGSLHSGNSPFARVRLRRGPVVLVPPPCGATAQSHWPRPPRDRPPRDRHPRCPEGRSQEPRGSALTRPQASASRSALPTGFEGQRRTRGPPAASKLPGAWTCEAPGGGGGGSSLHPQALRPR